MTSTSMTINVQKSKVTFEIKKLGILTVKSTINDFTGQIFFDKNALADLAFNVCVNPITIDTGNIRRDKHLRSKDFFHVHEHPAICFRSTSLQSDENGYRAIGDLSMLGVTNEISIPFSFSGGIFSGTFTLNRLEYGLGIKFPAFIVRKTISISINCITQVS